MAGAGLIDELGCAAMNVFCAPGVAEAAEVRRRWEWMAIGAMFDGKRACAGRRRSDRTE